jgi:putative flippase GtrA
MRGGDPCARRRGLDLVSFSALIFRYASFAAVATLANLATQRGVLWFDGSDLGLVLAILAGTAVGLLIKYLLDKRWIFNDPSSGFRTHSRKFTLYAIMGVVTTLIFWGMETGFWIVWQTDLMREIGAVLGLSIGYVTKYNLDRRYVFTGGRLGIETAT